MYGRLRAFGELTEVDFVTQPQDEELIVLGIGYSAPLTSTSTVGFDVIGEVNKFVDQISFGENKTTNYSIFSTTSFSSKLRFGISIDFEKRVNKTRKQSEYEEVSGQLRLDYSFL